MKYCLPCSPARPACRARGSPAFATSSMPACSRLLERTLCSAVNTCADTSTTLNGQPAVDLSGLTADQQAEAGLTCGGIKATPTTPSPSPCLASEYGSTLLRIPAPSTGNNDSNPSRIRQRNLFDVSLGHDNLFNGDRYKWSLQVTGVNMANKVALYNFLSTFSGTHFVTPRSLTAELGFHF